MYSKAQYIRQFKKWGFVKNSTGEQWKIIAREVHKRKARGKATEVVINNTAISDQKLRKEISRYGFDTDYEHASGTKFTLFP